MGLLIKFSISSCFTMSGHRYVYINFGENQASIENWYQCKCIAYEIHIYSLRRISDI